MSSLVQGLTYTIILRENKTYAAKPYLAAMVSFEGQDNLTLDQLQKAGPHNGKWVWAKNLVKSNQKIPLEKVQVAYKNTVGAVLSRFENEFGPINFALPIPESIYTAPEFIAKALSLLLMTQDTLEFCKTPFSLPPPAPATGPIASSLLTQAVGENFGGDLEAFASAEIVIQVDASTADVPLSQEGSHQGAGQANSSLAPSAGQTNKPSNVFARGNGGGKAQTQKAVRFFPLVDEASETALTGQTSKSSTDDTLLPVEDLTQENEVDGQESAGADVGGNQESAGDVGGNHESTGDDGAPLDVNPSEVGIGGGDQEMDDDRVAHDALSMATLLSVEEQNHPVVAKLVETVKHLQGKIKKQDKMIMSLNQLTVNQELTLRTFHESSAEDVAKSLMPSLKAGLGDIKKQMVDAMKEQMDQIKGLVKEEGKSALGTEIAGLKSSIASLATKAGDNFRLTQTSLGQISLISSDLTAAGLGRQQQDSSFSPRLGSTPLTAPRFSSTPSPVGRPAKSPSGQLSRWGGGAAVNNSGLKLKSDQGKIKSAARSLAPELATSQGNNPSSNPNLSSSVSRAKNYTWPSLPRLTQDQVDQRLGRLQGQSGTKRAKKN